LHLALIPRFAALVVVFSAGFGHITWSQNAAAPGPSATPQNPLPGTPPPATAPAAATDLQSCLSETGDYVAHGKTVTYVIGITNTCDKRLKCTIDANVTGAKGSSFGHTTIILGASSSGAAAKKTYAMKVKSAGGTAQVSRDCKTL
jgi:hypothetical protein